MSNHVYVKVSTSVKGGRDEAKKKKVENTITTTSNGDVYRNTQGRGKKQKTADGRSTDGTAVGVHGILQ